MTGKYRHNIDSKGRLFVPAKLREELGESFYVTIGLKRSLMILPEDGWNAIEGKKRLMPMAQAQNLRFFFANAARCEPDKQGRILLPQHLREYAGLEKDVAFIGTSNRAELWDAQRWASFNAELDDSSLIEVMEELQF